MFNVFKILKYKKTKGFALVEILVVISLIALLVSILLVDLNESRKKHATPKRLLDILTIIKALELYYDKYGYYPEPSCDCRLTLVPFDQKIDYLLFLKKALAKKDDDKGGKGKGKGGFEWDSSGDGNFLSVLREKGFLSGNIKTL